MEERLGTVSKIPATNSPAERVRIVALIVEMEEMRLTRMYPPGREGEMDTEPSRQEMSCQVIFGLFPLFMNKAIAIPGCVP